MVVGIDRWRDHFADYADRYALVGGVACDQLMADAGLQFRATKDLDIVLVIELLDVAFAEAFWGFIQAPRATTCHDETHTREFPNGL